MSVFQATLGNLEPAFVKLNLTSPIDIVAENGPTTVASIHVANIDTATAVHVTIEAYDTVNAVSYYLCYQHDVAAMGYLDLDGVPLPGKWKLRATAETADKLHVTATYTLPVGRR